jgi:hypothetical protein
MRANRAFELIIARGGLEPAFLADRGRVDRIEIVSVEDGEVVLFWELPAKPAAKLIRELRSDLVMLDSEDFIESWHGRDAAPEPLP